MFTALSVAAQLYDPHAAQATLNGYLGEGVSGAFPWLLVFTGHKGICNQGLALHANFKFKHNKRSCIEMAFCGTGL